MRRLKHFVSNLRLREIIGLLLAVVCVMFAIRQDAKSGLWTISIPLLLGAAGLGYALRNVIVKHFRVAGFLLNFLLVAVGVATFVLPAALKDEAANPAFRLSIAAVIGFYGSCYFFLMSDPRIVREE